MAHRPVLILENAYRFKKKDVPITAIEIDIMYWLAENLTDGGVAEMLTYKAPYINKRIGILYIKTGCSTHAGLMAFAFKYGLLFYVDGVLMKWKTNTEPEEEK